MKGIKTCKEVNDPSATKFLWSSIDQYLYYNSVLKRNMLFVDILGKFGSSIQSLNSLGIAISCRDILGPH